MHFAVADLHKQMSGDCRNHWIACDPQDLWSPGGVSMGVEDEATYGVMLQISFFKNITDLNNSQIPNHTVLT